MVVLHLSPKSAIIAIFKMRNESGTEKTARQAEDRPVSSTEPSRTAGGSPAAGHLLQRGCSQLPRAPRNPHCASRARGTECKNPVTVFMLITCYHDQVRDVLG